MTRAMLQSVQLPAAYTYQAGGGQTGDSGQVVVEAP